jgi:hypothetical protein
MTINISGQVPAEAQNGMYEHEDAWLEDRTPDELVAVVKIQRAKLTLNDAAQTRAAVMKFTHIEPLEGAAATKALDLLEAATKTRGGAVLVPDSELGIFDESVVEDVEREPADV